VDKYDYMFSYGMNTNKALMMLRCRDATCLGVGFILQHKLNFKYHLDITRTGRPDHLVHGLIWQLTDDDVETIDSVEGYPVYYDRIMLPVQKKVDFGLSVFRCWTYQMVDKEAQLEMPDERYYELVKEGYKENNIPINQLQEAYLRCNMMMEINNGY
jgi:gamma-glutamylcyclotransferase (GGCT)/AIG2-like uncharacterized protein YtfP